MSNGNKRPVSVQDIISEMKVGWNLGNSLESPKPDNPQAVLEEYETSWGNPKTTKEMIHEVVKAGFNVIRVPVSWEKMMNDEYQIASEWMDRVQEVIDYIYNEGAYVILNIHHEDQWLFLGDKTAELKAMGILNKVWTQIAERFKAYGHHLLFETMNETRLIGTVDEWNTGTQEARNTINKFNEMAISAIRKTGGNNDSRFIIIKTIGARYNVEAINDIIVPENDPGIILSVHLYVPYSFCMLPDGATYWGSLKDKAALSILIKSISEAANKKRLPLMIGEFGTIDKNNIDARAAYTAHVVREAKKNGIPCILWDNNIAEGEFSYSIFDRNKLSWRHPQILKALIDNS
jgi:Endoglucanase